MKTRDELMTQTMLDSGEARHLAALLGYSVSPALYTKWCRESAERGLMAEKRDREWYVNRAAWVRWLKTPKLSGAAGHKKNRD